MDMKLEVLVIPVSDVDRAQGFYARLGWRLDADFPSITAFGLCSSRRQARDARSSLAPGSRQPRQAQAAVTW